MLKRLICYLLVCLTTMTPMAANANLSGVLDQLANGAVANVNAPGRFSSAARTSVTFGGASIRLAPATNTPNLISMTPPSFEAGCAGVSMFFGGFSFISGREFEALLRNIASGVALGFVGHLALKTLCPMCEAVAQLMQRINQAAAMMARDACKYGATLAKTWMKEDKPKDREGKCSEASRSSADSGSFSDILGSMSSGLCNLLKDMNAEMKQFVEKELVKWANAGLSGPELDRKRNNMNLEYGGFGNRTWLMTGQYIKGQTTEDYNTRTLLMNLLGTTISVERPGEGQCNGGDVYSNPNATIFCTPKMEVRQVMDLFMCGVVATPGVGAAVTRYCSNASTRVGDGSKHQVMECEDSRDDSCMIVRSKNLDESRFKTWEGLGPLVNKTLREGVLRVRNNQPLWNGQSSDVTGRRLVGLIQSAPFPLYQVINSGAIYPVAATDLLDSMSMLIAEQLAVAYFQEMNRLAGRSDKPSELSREMLDRFTEAVSTMKGRVEGVTQVTAQQFTLTESMNQQVRSLNQAIQREVMTAEVLGGNNFGRGLAGLVSGAPDESSLNQGSAQAGQ